jgi:hypothetical protein
VWTRILFCITCALSLIAPNVGLADEERGVTVRWQNGFRIVDKQDESLY